MLLSPSSSIVLISGAANKQKKSYSGFPKKEPRHTWLKYQLAWIPPNVSETLVPSEKKNCKTRGWKILEPSEKEELQNTWLENFGAVGKKELRNTWLENFGAEA